MGEERKEMGVIWEAGGEIISKNSKVKTKNSKSV